MSLRIIFGYGARRGSAPAPGTALRSLAGNLSLLSIDEYFCDYFTPSRDDWTVPEFLLARLS
jgi:hypothetical protein